MLLRAILWPCSETWFGPANYWPKPLKDCYGGNRSSRSFSVCVQRLVEENQPLSEQMIKDIHLVIADKKKKMTEVAYRRVPVRTMELKQWTGSAYDCSIDGKLLVDYDAVRKYGDQTIQFHISFESIHPFIDGNERVGYWHLELMKAGGYPPIDINLRIDCPITKHLMTSFKGSLSTMSDLFAKYINERLICNWRFYLFDDER